MKWPAVLEQGCMVVPQMPSANGDVRIGGRTMGRVRSEGSSGNDCHDAG